MSIYATWLEIADDNHAEDCAQWVPIADLGDSGIVAVYGDGRRMGLDDTKPCTCRCGPILYRGSHVLPSDDDPRHGSVYVCAIPGFIEREGRPAVDGETEAEDRVHPWLRLSVGAETAVLDRALVVRMHETLGGWLMRCATTEEERTMTDAHTDAQAVALDEAIAATAVKAGDRIAWLAPGTRPTATAINAWLAEKLRAAAPIIRRPLEQSRTTRDEVAARAIQAAEDRVAELEAERDELWAAFDLQWNASRRATKRWQDAHPGNDLVWPDAANLMVWLMERLADAERALGWLVRLHDGPRDDAYDAEKPKAWEAARAAIKPPTEGEDP